MEHSVPIESADTIALDDTCTRDRMTGTRPRMASNISRDRRDRKNALLATAGTKLMITGSIEHAGKSAGFERCSICSVSRQLSSGSHVQPQCVVS